MNGDDETAGVQRQGSAVELRVRPTGARYVLAGREVFTGDALEARSGRGWLTGAFYWDENPDHHPLLLVGGAGDSPQSDLPLLPEVRCRWPEGREAV